MFVLQERRKAYDVGQMDATLTAIVGILQILLGAMGVFVSLRTPKKEHHWYWIGGFVGVGLIGVGLTFWTAYRSSNAQQIASQELIKAVTESTNSNVSATNANNSALAALGEMKKARDEARAAKDELARLISKSSKETTTAILNLGTETRASIRAAAIGLPPRRIPSENRAQLIRFFSEKRARVQISALANDAEAFQFSQDWYDILKAAGWTIEGNTISSFIVGGAPGFGIVIKFRGETVLPGQNFQVPDTEPVSYIGRAASSLKVTISGQRFPNMEEGLIVLEFHARPPSD